MKTIREDLTEIIKKRLKECKLRPEIEVDETFTKYKNQPGSFMGIHLYWNESYYDDLSASPKIDKLCELMKKEIESPRSIEIGESDGHLFFYISFTDEEMESEAEKIFNLNHPELNP